MKKSLYRNIKTNFWKDIKIVDKFTKDDTYFYLYLLTNPNTNLCGCYEISFKQMELESKLTKEEILNELDNLTKFNIISYSEETSEILLKNVPKHNWTTSNQYLTGVCEQLKEIKNEKYLKYLIKSLITMNTLNANEIEGIDTIDTSSIDTLYTILDSISTSISNKKIEKSIEEKETNQQTSYKPDNKELQHIADELGITLNKVSRINGDLMSVKCAFRTREEFIEKIKECL